MKEIFLRVIPDLFGDPDKKIKIVFSFLDSRLRGNDGGCYCTFDI